MAHSQPNHREITLKVVYYGPGLAGKSTLLSYLHRALRQDARGQIVSVNTGADRTLFFDFFPLSSPRLRGNSLRVQIYTTAGEVKSESTRRGLLEHVDGLVFVADSQRKREADNVQSLDELRQCLGKLGMRLDQVPHVFAWNKRDLDGVLTSAELSARLNPGGAPAFETVAPTGKGVFDSLKAITGLVLAEVTGRRKATGQNGAGPTGGPNGVGATAGSISSNDRRLSAAQKALAGLKEGREESSGPISLDDQPISISGLLQAPPSLRDGKMQALRDSPPGPTFIKERPGQVATVIRPREGERKGPGVSESTQPRKRSPTWLHPLSPEAADQPAGARREIWLSHVVPKSSLRDQIHDVEIDLATGQNAQAVRRASGIFTVLCAPELTREPEEGPAWGALTLGLPVDRYLRFRESVRNAEAGTASQEDGLFALFFLIDAVLRR